jgi:hypothetical protein
MPDWLNPTPRKTEKELQREAEIAHRDEARRQKETRREEERQGDSGGPEEPDRPARRGSVR